MIISQQKISIHSLVKRETIVPSAFIRAIKISIHSLVKRETFADYEFKCSCCDFNPLPRKEGDGVTSEAELKAYISIHSLVKRETCRTGRDSGSSTNFNPLPRKEGDHAKEYCADSDGNFNPLPRKEGDVPFTGRVLKK